MSNITINSQTPPPKETDFFKKVCIFIMVLSFAVFVMPAIAIILVADAFAIGAGTQVAINMTIGAAVLAVIMPFVFALTRKIGGSSTRAQMVTMQRDMALLQQDVAELRHQTLVISESAEFSKQLLMSKEKASAKES
ncbi:MAG TPA: hypothetical protein V6C86_00200 [Oculatellaceae cyanobacterium]